MMGIADRLHEIRSRIDSAARSVGRDPRNVELVAVSKNQPLSALLEAYEAGQRHFGESRLQEALPKIAEMPSDAVWHFIGKLQSNKARRVSQFFNVIHTIESETQLREIVKSEQVVDVFIEVNLAREPQKSGILPEKLEEFHELLLQLPATRFRGLMTIGPIVENPEQSRALFRELAGLNQKLGGTWLSMGMSDDFEVAIQEGSTHVRVGTAIFGSRTE